MTVTLTQIGNLPSGYYIMKMVYHDGYVWVTGGNADRRWDARWVWSSSNLSTWSHASNAPLPTDDYISASSIIEYDGKLWLLGATLGEDGGIGRKVLYTTSGASWVDLGDLDLPATLINFATVVYDSKLWVIGGSVGGAASRKVYWSTNGIEWTEAGTDALPVGKSLPRCLSYDGKIWMLGGSNSSTVYWSTDGISWTLVGTNPLPTAYSRGAVVYNSKMWFFGSGSSSNTTPGQKVYSSTDGLTWTYKSLTPTADSYYPIIYDNKMWLVGTFEWLINNGPEAIMYWTTDGVTWTKSAFDTPFQADYSAWVVPFGSKVYVLGGSYDSWWTDAVLRSSDGINWSTIGVSYQSQEWEYHTSLSYDGKLWVIGGEDANWNAAYGQAQVFNTTDGVNWVKTDTGRQYWPDVLITGSWDWHSYTRAVSSFGRKTDHGLLADGFANSYVVSQTPRPTRYYTGFGATEHIDSYFRVTGDSFLLAIDLYVPTTQSGDKTIFGQDLVAYDDNSIFVYFDGDDSVIRCYVNDVMVAESSTIPKDNAWHKFAFYYSMGESLPYRGTTWLAGVKNTYSCATNAGAVGSTGGNLQIGTGTYWASWPHGMTAIAVYCGDNFELAGNSLAEVEEMIAVLHAEEFGVVPSPLIIGSMGALPYPTIYHCSCVHDGKMWVIGGDRYYQELPDEYWYREEGTKKLYWSTDGATWTEAGTDALPVGLQYSAVVSLSGKLWILGGHQDGAGSSDVYSSTDGTDWALAGSLPYPLECHDAAVVGGKIMVFGGYAYIDGEWYSNVQVYSSSNGIDWTTVVEDTDIVPAGWEEYFSSAASDSGVYVAGGTIDYPSSFGREPSEVFFISADVDSDYPVVHLLEPTIEDVPTGTPIRLHLTDDTTGVNVDSISVSINSVLAVDGSVLQPGFTGSVDLDVGPEVPQYHVTIYRTVPYTLLEVNTIDVYCEDLGDPKSTTEEFTFACGVHPPVAVITYNDVKTLLGAIIQLDGRQSYDRDNLPLTYMWSFTMIPIGSTVNPAQTVPPQPEPYPFTSLRPNNTAVSFVPDKLGTYEVELVVNNGYLDSEPATALVRIGMTQTPCGEGIIPEAEFLWNYISNFWDLVDDKQYISKVWAATMQAIGSDMLKLWSYDYNKSIATIQNVIHRRWQLFSLRTDLREEPQRVIVGNTTGGSDGHTGVLERTDNTYTICEGTDDSGETFHGTLPLETNNTVVPSSIKLYVGNREDETEDQVATDNGSGGITGYGGHTVSGTVSYTTGAISIVESGTIWSEGQFVVSTFQNYSEYTDEFYLTSSLSRLAKRTNIAGRLLVVAGDGATIQRVYDVDTDEDGDINYSVAIVDQDVLEDGLTAATWSIPHLLHIPSLDLEDYGARVGDIMVFTVTRRDAGISAEIQAQVVGVDRSRLGFEFSLGIVTPGTDPTDVTLFMQLVRDLKIVGPEATDTEAQAAAISVLSFMPPAVNIAARPFTPYKLVFRAKEIVHNRAIRVSSKYVTIPSLQEEISANPTVLLENWDFTIENGLILFQDGIFTAASPSPEALWAECTLWDNSQEIENNFGKFVGLSRYDQAALTTRVPYLSAVRGLMYAMTNGPTVANIRLGLQILLSLPFADERSRVIDIKEPFGTEAGTGLELGRVIVEGMDQNEKPTGHRFFYFYPIIVGLEDNPATGVPYAVGDVIEQWAPISKGAEIQDYVKDPTWWRKTLYGNEVLKFFIFRVLINCEVFNVEDLSLVTNFLRRIKPAYTKFITLAFKQLTDDVLESVEDERSTTIGMSVYDNPGMTPPFRLDDLNAQGVPQWVVGAHPFTTRSPLMKRDVYLSWVGDAPHALSASGFVAAYIRGRQDGTASTPTVEGDILAILRQQLSSGTSYDALYEIASVISANDLLLQGITTHRDPETYMLEELTSGLYLGGMYTPEFYLKMDDNADTDVVLDSSGNGRNGTLFYSHGNPWSSVVHVAGHIDGAFKCPGTSANQNCGIEILGGYVPTGLGHFCYEIWYNTFGDCSHKIGELLWVWKLGTMTRIMITVADHIIFEVLNSDDIGDWAQMNGPAYTGDSNWHHLVCAFNYEWTTEKCRVWLDRGKVTPSYLTDLLSTPITNVGVGAGWHTQVWGSALGPGYITHLYGGDNVRFFEDFPYDNDDGLQAFVDELWNGGDGTTNNPIRVRALALPAGGPQRATVLRRMTNPVLRGADLVATGTDTVTSATADFKTNGVQVDDHLVLEWGDSTAEYRIEAEDAGNGVYISEGTLKLVELDGTAAVVQADTWSYRIVRPSMIKQCWKNAKSVYNEDDDRMELEVMDPGDLLRNPVLDPPGVPMDAFTPGMVGASIRVSDSQNPLNDGVFIIATYLNSGRVVISSGSVTSDTGAQSNIVIDGESYAVNQSWHPYFERSEEMGPRDRVEVEIPS